MQTAPDIFILAAPHFDEIAVVICLSELRGQGITAVLVAPTTSLLGGKRGIIFCPDTSLSQISEFDIKEKQVVIVAGGPESASTILTDPRAHQLIQQVLAANGLIAGMRHTCPLIEELGLMWLQDNKRFLRQEGEETAVFLQHLITIHLHK